MNIGNQFYSTLSWLARQAFLMQSELPIVLNVFDTDYQLWYIWRGVQIENIENRMVSQNSVNEITNFSRSSAVALYSLC